jgi:hypothetical protein
MFIIDLSDIDGLALAVMFEGRSFLVQKHLVRFCSYAIATYPKLVPSHFQDRVDIWLPVLAQRELIGVDLPSNQNNTVSTSLRQEISQSHKVCELWCQRVPAVRGGDQMAREGSTEAREQRTCRLVHRQLSRSLFRMKLGAKLRSA